MILAERFPQNGPLHFQDNSIPVIGIKVKSSLDSLINTR